jgi:hypothetical protein
MCWTAISTSKQPGLMSEITDLISVAQVLDRCIDFAADLRAPPSDGLPDAAEAVALLRAEALRLAAGAWEHDTHVTL